MITSIKNLLVEKKVFGFITKASLLILLALIICTCSGVKLTLGNQTLGSQIDYSSFSGKLVRQIHDPMGCATLRTDVLVFHSWPLERWLTWQPYHLTPGMVYYQSPVLMPRRCSQTRWYPYQLIIHSFSNPFRTEWIVPRPSSHIASRRASLQGVNSQQTRRNQTYRVSTQQSTGRTRVTTPMTVRNSNSSFTTSPVSGKGRTTSSTIGGLRKPR